MGRVCDRVVWLDKEFPTIYCLCGSSRFKMHHERVMRELTLQGHLVIGMGMFGHTEGLVMDVFRCSQCGKEMEGPRSVLIPSEREEVSACCLAPVGRHKSPVKEILDQLHLRKIDLADVVYVINCGGYIGESTRAEIDYATKHGKSIEYLEPVTEAVK